MQIIEQNDIERAKNENKFQQQKMVIKSPKF